MALKYLLKSLEGLADPIKALYVAQADGTFTLDVEGAVSATKLAEFRDNNVELKKQLEAFQGIDPVKAREAITFQEGAKDKQLFDNGKIDELINTRTAKMKDEYETTINTLKSANETQGRQLEGLLIDSSVRSEALKSSVLPTAVDDVLLRAKAVFKIKDGVATPFDDQGRVIYGKDGVNPMQISEWVGGLAKTAAHLFQGNDGGGAPRSQHKAGGADSANMSATQKIAAGLQQ